MGGLYRQQLWDPTKGPIRKNREEIVQLDLCKYLRQFYPGVLFFSDIGSGAKLSKSAAGKAKMMRSNPGWPDTMIAAPSPRGYTGLFIELKQEGTELRMRRDGTKVRQDDYKIRKKGDWASLHVEQQHNCQEALKAAGFWAAFAVGIEEARQLTDWYFCKVDDGLNF